MTKMRYKLLGKSGLKVSEFCLGAMTFGEDWGGMLPGASKEESKKIFDLFAEAGGNFIDTANIYQNGTSEKFVGEFVAERRDEFVIGTKYTLSTNPNYPNASGNNRKNLMQSVDASLKRLNTDYVDLFWVHIWDGLTPVEEVMRGLDDLVNSGKVHYVGISDAPAWVVSQANTLSQYRGWTSFVGLQIMYNLIERTPESELLPMAKAMDVGVTVWSPLAGGLLSGKYAQDNNEPKRYGKDNPLSEAFLNERNLAIAKEVQDIAQEIGKSSSQVSLNWIRQQKERGVFIPIIGARKSSHIQDNLGCLDFELSSEHMKRLDEKSKIPLGFPHDFMANDSVRAMVFGNNYSSIDNHRA